MDGSSAQNGQIKLAQIVRRDAGFVASVLRRFGVRSCDIDDARQDVFMVVHRRLPEFEPRASHRSWLYRICVCVAADYRKRAHRRRERLGEASDQASSDARAEQVAIALQLADGLRTALERLDPHKRAVFELYEFEELTIAEVAAQLGCPLKTAFSRLYAARRELRADLRRAGYAAAWWLLLPPWKAHALSAGSLYAGSKLTAAGCAASALVIAITLVPPRAQNLSTSFSSAPNELQEPQLTPSFTATTPRPSAPEPPARPRRERAPRARAEIPKTAAAQAIERTAWIQAPAGPEPQPELEPRPTPTVGLDEVLSTTSIRPLLRIGPKGQPFVLVPKH